MVDKHRADLDLVNLKRELLSEGWGVKAEMGRVRGELQDRLHY